MDRGYHDFVRLYALHQTPAFFVTRNKSNTDLHGLYSNLIGKETGVRCDQIVALDGFYSNQSYPDKLRSIKFNDDQRDKRLTFLTNRPVHHGGEDHRGSMLLPLAGGDDL
jgi:hypothetical protein